jgi:hypothetical protein
MALFVDRDGRGGVAGSDTAWPASEREGNPLKPYAGHAAAVQAAASGEEIVVREEISSTPYPAWTVTGKTGHASPITLRGYGTERPTMLGFTLEAKKFVMQQFRSLATMQLSRVDQFTLRDIEGRSRSSASTPTGNLLIDGADNLMVDRVDIEYTGTMTQTAGVAACNMRDVSGKTQWVNVHFKDCRFDNFTSDLINTPNVYCKDFLIEGCEFARTFSIPLPNGEHTHTDLCQMANDSDNFTFVGNIIHSGRARLLMQPNQSTLRGSHRGAKILENVWYLVGDFAARFYSCPDLQFIANTVYASSSPNANRAVNIYFNQDATQPAAEGTQRVRLKANILSGLLVDNRGGTVTFTSDSGRNMFTGAAGISGYTKRTGTGGDVADGVPTFVDPTVDAATRKLPDLQLATGSRGINEGPLLDDADAMLGVPVLDARGASRVGTRADIGAYEYGSTPQSRPDHLQIIGPVRPAGVREVTRP